MRLQFFRTPKPKKFSFHTRYYNENKLARENSPAVEKGSFKKYRGRFDSKFQTNDDGVAVNSSNKLMKMLIIATLISAAALSYLYVKGGWIIAVSILALIFAFAKRK
ncbi:MAG: hypothetical protein LRY27_04620 [Chitinophagales bacterium]|nr:hypothetical protein [Chitinophagales bacterium]